MGIQGLWRRMQNANQGSKTERHLVSTKDQRRTSAILDGPSFVHWIWHRLEVRQDFKDGGITHRSTYEDVVASALDWLEKLEAYGFSMYAAHTRFALCVPPLTCSCREAIIFDGALPTSKRDTRLERLAKYTKGLKAYKILHEAALKQVTQKASKRSDVWTSSSLNRARRDIAAPAFLIPAAVEALLESKYSTMIYVVPDEADRYCVAAARTISEDREKCDVMIFTDDSDLLVFDLGPQTIVTWLSELEEDLTGDGPILRGYEFAPNSIAHQVGCTDLRGIAFRMAHDNTISFKGAKAALLQTGGKEASADGFDVFMADYQLESQDAAFRHLHSQRKRVSYTPPAMLDTRLSELIHDVMTRSTGTSQCELEIFLPVLLDDPETRSAWTCGSLLRQAAYSILLAGSETCGLGVREHRRAGSTVLLTTFTPVVQNAQSIHWLITARAAFETTGSRTAVAGWRYLVVRCMLTDMQSEDLPLPTHDNLLWLITAQPSYQCYQWVKLRLLAQYQATFYSLRTLGQILSYVAGAENSGGLDADLLELESLLRGMPTFATFFGTRIDDDEQKWTHILTSVMGELDATNDVHQPKRRKRSSKVLKTESRGKVSKTAEANKALANNPFAALSNE